MHKEIDYYTVKGINANKHLKLNLIETKFYNWSDIKDLIKDRLEDETDTEIIKIVRNNAALFEDIVSKRRKRENEVKRAFKEKNIDFIPHSFLVRNYIMYGRRDLNYIVDTMYRMKILFENCDIKKQWEQHKINGNKQIYTFQDKDNFYETIFTDYVKANPKRV